MADFSMSKFCMHLLGVCLVLAAPAALTQPVSEQKPTELKTIDRVDLSRYMGVWHEIARYPNRFQRQCVGPSSATYSLQADGSVSVLNRCQTASGQWDEALGQARQLGGPTSARLQVRFAPAWLSFLPMVWGDYWIVALGEDYDWVVVSEPRREYLWVLSRQASWSSSEDEAMKVRLKQLGFDPARLVRNTP